ncbi:MAG: hypothetical protein HDS83_02430 [Bacteroidales bacterium]|nr:hypothetical protein [Bacteroidales bacterium]
MQNYSFDIANARFIASGVAVQAKGLAYRLKHNEGRDVMRQENYNTTSGGFTLPSATEDGSRTINERESEWNGSGDYWLGRNVLTNLAINVPKEGVLLINDIVMNVSLQKEIVKTALVGRKGTIKEYITDGDYQISMSVGIVAVNDYDEIIDQYPEKAINQLREILTQPEALEVSSGFLNLFEISHIVVTGFAVKQMTHTNRQVIEITAISDDDYVIKCNEY